METVFDAFQPATRLWFNERYGAPTRAQRLGWPPIQRGENTLILSPTGSGKTLAAFLWGIDRICAALSREASLKGVLLLYVSPLKALNNDIARNLEEPLRGIRHTAIQAGDSFPQVATAVRTGDTLASARRKMLQRPPHILITTPESLYLLLTSPQAREILASVETVIVDEVHTLCGNKRGVHLALSLERLEALAGHPIQRIGLSATQRPLEEVARFVGGHIWQVTDDGERVLTPRPVTIVDAGVLKPMDLRIITPVPDLRRLPGGSIWPALIPRVLDEIRRHRTTLVFANSRRGAERAADRLNEQYAQEYEEQVPPGSSEALLVNGVPVGEGWTGTGRVGGPFRAHHGSVSRAVRLELERSLKTGKLPALIATSSLELGIDIGAVDAVLQIQSPRGISRGLQRIGRSGHMVGQTSYGRIYVTHREDLLDAAATVHGMVEGDIEPTHTPRNCLDILAQQIVAMVASEPWTVDVLFDLVRQAYGYEQLTLSALTAVLKMISGGYSSEAYVGLRPCLEWDRANGRLLPLPGTRLLAIRNGGTIPDRGDFQVYLPDGRTNLGTLDEEFVFETHVGDVFTLGSSTWRVLSIDEDRMVVADASGSTPRMPFWHGELPKRDYHMGVRLGAFRRQLAERTARLEWAPDSPEGPWPAEASPLFDWLAREYAMDDASARNAVSYVWQQIQGIGAISSDQTVVVERFADALGDQRLVIHTCFGARVNSVWAIALTHAFRERLGTTVEVQVNDDALLFRLIEGDREPPMDLIRSMTAEEARERVLQELPNSALFGAQFRMNAARALVLPRVRGGGRRTPFWLQRLRAKDLLAIARGWDDFPLVAETYRDCLRDVLDVEHLSQVLDDISTGRIQVVEAETVVPSPVAAGLLLQFAGIHLYDTDAPKLERQIQALSVNRELLAELLDDGSLAELLRPEVVHRVEQELQHVANGYQARTVDELAVLLRELGDLSDAEIALRCLGDASVWIEQLERERRAVCFSTADGSTRWVSTDLYPRYRDALGLSGGLGGDEPPEAEAARRSILRQYARTHGPFTREMVLARYALAPEWLEHALSYMVEQAVLLRGRLTPEADSEEWCDRAVLERLHRQTLSLLRREVQAVTLPDYADFMVRWQGVHPEQRLEVDALESAITQLTGLLLPAEVWERDVFPARVPDYNPEQLDTLCSQGSVFWQVLGVDGQHARLRFLWAGEGAMYIGSGPEPEALAGLSGDAARLYAFLQREAFLSTRALASALSMASLDLEHALVELVLRGLVTNDRLDVVRELVGGQFAASKGEGLGSSLDAALADWRESRRPATVRRPSRAEMSAGRRRVAQKSLENRPVEGRWSIVHRYGLLGQQPEGTDPAMLQARQLLQGYGLLSRDILDGQAGLPAWSAVYPHLYRMELSGEIRRGYFVQGRTGLQYALPDALDSLRQWARADAPGKGQIVLLNALDPALVYASGDSLDVNPAQAPAEGTAPDGLLTLARIPTNYVVLVDGVPLLAYEHGGGRWRAQEGALVEMLTEGASLVLSHLTRPGGLAHRPRRVLANTWNGESPLVGEAGSLLAELGFRRDTPGMVWDGLRRPAADR